MTKALDIHEIDEARAEEARIRWRKQPEMQPSPEAIAAALAREGWKPVDPDLIRARAILVEERERAHFGGAAMSLRYRSGTYDRSPSIRAVVRALKEGRT